MTLTQSVIILAGLFIGYRLVSYMLSPGTGDDDKPSRPSPDHRKAVDDGEGHPHAWIWHDAPGWYQTLGVAESASREDIERAYRAQISQYHPDKVATLGEDIRRVAEARTKEINAAYEIAVRLRR